jgi:Flp pilus assembly protein TadG
MIKRILFEDKKAQLFTIIGIVLIGLMFVTFELFSTIHQRQSVKTRVATMNSYLNSIEENLERQMYIAGFRIIFLAEDRITSTGTYVNDVDAFFEEAFYNGTIYGVPDGILNGVIYDNLTASIENKGPKINVVITITNSTISVGQDDPWHVKFTIASDFIMEDQGGLARWEKRQVVSAYIPVEGFEDPVYVVNTNAQVPRKINRTIYEGNLSNIANLNDHVDKGYYAVNPDAPNFLMRLEGDLSADPNGNGIETFVDTQELLSQGFTPYDKSVVDHIYFSASNPPASTVAGMPGWFKLDSDHKTYYNV